MFQEHTIIIIEKSIHIQKRLKVDSLLYSLVLYVLCFYEHAQSVSLLISNIISFVNMMSWFSIKVVQLLVTVVLEFVILCQVSNIDVFVLSVKRQDIYIHFMNVC